jgi:hypothetical protein
MTVYETIDSDRIFIKMATNKLLITGMTINEMTVNETYVDKMTVGLMTINDIALISFKGNF